MTIAIVGVGETDYTYRDERPVAAMILDAMHRVRVSFEELERRRHPVFAPERPGDAG